jgi:dephospho-CoA kinase
MNEEQLERKPVRIAITGGIGAGKSAALAIFKDHGAAVLKTDDVVHSLLDRDQVRAEASRLTGLGTIPPGADGRRLIADAVFSDAGKLQALQQLLFPLVRDEVNAWFGGSPTANAPAAVVEVPMLFEAGMEELFDIVILIAAPEELRKSRCLGSINTPDFERRAARQIPDADKKPRCRYSYENTGSLDDLDVFVSGVLKAAAGDGS